MVQFWASDDSLIAEGSSENKMLYFKVYGADSPIKLNMQMWDWIYALIWLQS